ALANLGGYQLSVGSHLIFYDACLARTGTYDQSGVSSSSPYESIFGPSYDATGYLSRDMPEVCRSGPPGPSPQVLQSLHLMDGLGIAFGILAPAASGTSTWGNGDGTITAADGTLLPSPVRYQVVEQSVLLFWPSIGIGYSPIPELSFGATFMWGISTIDFTTMTSAGGGPEDPAQDVRAQLELADYFVPGVVLSANITPIDALDIAVSARFSDAIDGEGSLTVTTGAFGTSMPGSYQPYTTRLEGASLRAPQPWEFGLAIRYADRIHPRHRNPEQAGRLTGQVDDPMLNERWDIELDAVYIYNGEVTDFVTRPPQGTPIGICEEDSDCSSGPTITANLPVAIPITKGWADQLSLRLGGDVNVIPGMLAIRGGVHFETSGMNAQWQTPDFMPGMRLGFHLGATFRIERFDVSIAYGHIFQFDHTVTDPRVRHAASTGGRGVDDDWTCRNADGTIVEGYDPDMPVVNRGCYPPGFGSIVNGGTFRAEFNVLSLNLRYHFE
ncbi:MAG: hypothetical protein KC619_14655, partial [Myxococcales bacterium]|nr:hypothetical protein [Myxococcales bacterium]